MAEVAETIPDVDPPPVEEDAADVVAAHRGDEGLLEGVVIQENFEAASDSDVDDDVSNC